MAHRRRLGVLLLLCLTQCELFPFSPNEVRLDEEQRDQTAKNLRKLAKVEPSDPFRIALMADGQWDLTEARDAVRDLNKRDDIAFVAHGGDITQMGLAKEYRWMNESFRRLKVPFFTVVGNHDLLANGKAIYEAMYGPTDYVFDFGRTRFVFLDNNSREYDFNGKNPDLDFLQDALPADGSYERAVVVSHTPPWSPDMDPELVPRFVEILREGGVVLSLHGHVHQFADEAPYGDGVRYVVADDLLSRSYLVITIGSSGTFVEKVFF